MKGKSEEWWITLFLRTYNKEPTKLELEQFKKSYYVPDWKGIGRKVDRIKKK